MAHPIVSMVDQACGVTAEDRARWEVERPKREAEQKAAQDAATQRLLNAADAALWWWRMHRPVGWKLHQHQRNPIVNCKGDEEKLLAEACAILSLEGWPIRKPGTPPAVNTERDG